MKINLTFLGPVIDQPGPSTPHTYCTEEQPDRSTNDKKALLGKTQVAHIYFAWFLFENLRGTQHGQIRLFYLSGNTRNGDR